MYQYKGLTDTIAAIVTPLGAGGIGIVRVSGLEAIAIADKVLRFANHKPLAQSPSHCARYGCVIDVHNGDILDDAIVILMRGPKSYTTQDTVEINGHGGVAVLRLVLDAVLNAGARLAGAGEFTKRAFLYGRIDLTQAEAVMDIIQAKTDIFARQSQRQLHGDLSVQLGRLRQELMDAYTQMEALINFPEDGIENTGLVPVADRLLQQTQCVAQLLASSVCGRILKEGARVVLCGRPNVGKSSLMNALLKEQRAIVTPIAGTTRDILEESARLKAGVPIVLVDTAGILEPRDMIEQEAVLRSRLTIDSADLLLLVLDHASALEEEDILLMEQLRAFKVLVVINKIDLEKRIDEARLLPFFNKDHWVAVCAHEARSIEALEEKIAACLLNDTRMDTSGVLISHARHIQALQETQKHLRTASALMDQKVSLEFVAEEVKCAVNQLDAITGRNVDADLLERVFSTFCIGK